MVVNVDFVLGRVYKPRQGVVGHLSNLVFNGPSETDLVEWS